MRHVSGSDIGRIGVIALTLGMTAALSACQKDGQPKGQVVASVNGEDITRRDLSTELTALKAGPNVDMKQVSPLVVDRLVDRKVLAEEARRQGIDKTPEYLGAEQRAKEIVLTDLLVTKMLAQQTPPTDEEVQRFINDNPHIFAGRQILQIDQVRTPAQGLKIEDLKPFNTNEAVADWLRKQGKQVQRGAATVDTATLPAGLMKQIASLPPGMPLVMSEGGLVLSSVIVGARPAAVPEARWNVLARQAMAAQRRQQSVANQIRSLRSAAKIQYQPGFSPPVVTGTAAPGAK